jgi:iron complex outermembrane receptor protein
MKIFNLTTLFLTATVLLNAQNTSNDIDTNFDDFMEVLEETTQIATKNKVGADHAPGIISVLKYEDMRRIGINNLYEALELLPSIEVILNKSGTRNLIFRGIGAIEGSGKVKVMLNGVEQNSAASGVIHFNLPIEIIERIEVIRGPASALYGEYAFSGIVDIITKKETNNIFAKYLTKDGTTSGAIVNYKKDDLSVNTIISYGDFDGARPDATDYQGNRHKVETLRVEKTFITDIQYKQGKIKIAINKSKKGEMWGVASLLPNNDNNENYRYDYETIELSHKFNLSDKLWLEPKIGYFKYNYWFNYTKMSSPMTMTAHQGYNKKYAKFDLSYGKNDHNFISGIELARTSQNDYGGEMSMMGKITPLLQNNELTKRELVALYFHDNISINNNMTINMGARYDKYNDNENKEIDSYLSPRVAIVYDMDKLNIFKFQYAQSFRVPTFHEQTNDKVKPEINKMAELQHILKKEYSSFKSTLFYSIIDSLIYSTGSMSYANKQENILNYGVEFEHTHNFSDNLCYYQIYLI